MYCISFIGAIIVLIIVLIIADALESFGLDNRYLGTIKWLTSIVVGIWWISGYLTTCDTLIGPSFK